MFPPMSYLTDETRALIGMEEDEIVSATSFDADQAGRPSFTRRRPSCGVV
jgi:hypothetical protein